MSEIVKQGEEKTNIQKKKDLAASMIQIFVSTDFKSVIWLIVEGCGEVESFRGSN